MMGAARSLMTALSPELMAMRHFGLLTTPFTTALSVFIMRTVSVVGKNVHIGSSLPSFSRNTVRQRNRILPTKAQRVDGRDFKPLVPPIPLRYFCPITTHP